MKTWLSWIVLLAVAAAISIMTGANGLLAKALSPNIHIHPALGLLTSTITITIWEIIFLRYTLAPAVQKFIEFLEWAGGVARWIHSLPYEAIMTFKSAFRYPNVTNEAPESGQDWKSMFHDLMSLAEEKDKENAELKAENDALQDQLNNQPTQTSTDASKRDRVWACEILGVSKTATSDEIKAAYRNLIKTLHPDKGGSEKLFMDVTEAYEKAK